MGEMSQTVAVNFKDGVIENLVVGRIELILCVSSGDEGVTIALASQAHIAANQMLRSLLH